VPEPNPEPIRVTFSRGTWVALIAFAFVLFAGVTTQLLVIEDQRSTTDRQLKTAVRQANRAIPLLDRTRPLVDQTTNAMPAIRRLGRDTQALVDDLRPLSRDLRNARAPEQLQAAGALARGLLAADAPEQLRAAGTLARTLVDADVGELTRALRRADLPRLVGEIRARQLIEKSSRAAESVPEMEQLLRESLEVQRETLELARQTQRAAERAARAAESIDRKTGPSLAPTSSG
jgi:hypothetical protein